MSYVGGTTASMSSTTPPSTDRVATLTDIGPREVQQDRAIAHIDGDGSWVVAVFDGLGGHDRGDEAAQAAADAFPARIDGPTEMNAAIAAANSAVWDLLPEDVHVPRTLGPLSHWPAGFEPLTTAAAAAWTPHGGLQTAWLGDSVLFFVPMRPGVPGMHSEPQGSWDSPIMNNALGFTPEPEDTSIGSMSEDDLAVLTGHIESDGLLVIAATDGLFDPIRIARYGPRGRFSADPHDNSIGFAIPEPQRSSARAVATALMQAARVEGLHDNAAIAVALAVSDSVVAPSPATSRC